MKDSNNVHNELQGLHLKTYFAASVQAAVELASRELGSDALLVNSRKTAPEARHLGEYEVVFAVTPQELDTAMPGEPERDSSGQPLDVLLGEFAELRSQMRQMRDMVLRTGLSGRAAALSPEAADALERLLAAGIEDNLAHEIVEAAQGRSARPVVANIGQARFAARPAAIEPRDFDACVTAELDARLQVDPAITLSEDRPKIVMLVGPPGAGKTSSLVKLAVTCGLTARRPVQLLSMDTLRIGSAEQLRTYASILGVGFQALDTVRALEQALEEHRGKGLILIDTPGFSPGTFEDSLGLTRFLSRHPEIETHLVLPCSMKPEDLDRTIARYDAFRPNKLLFTRLDETASFGAMIGAAIQSGKPVSFLSTGQQIPDDFEPASKARLLGLLNPRAAMAATAA